MLKEFRRKEIKNMLEREGEVQNSVLCQKFNVSEMTIRRDLDALSQNTSIVRTHGGAYLASANEMGEPPYKTRVQECCLEKAKIAEKALELVKDEQIIFLDSGTTTFYVAQSIPDDYRNIILTNGLNIADEAVNHSRLSVILIGGDLRQNTLSTSGPLAEEMLDKFRVDIAFLGANAIDEDGNIYVGTTPEVGLKNSVMKKSTKCYVLADSSKFNTHNLVCYTNARQVDGVITDGNISPETVKKLKARKIHVIIAS